MSGIAQRWKIYALGGGLGHFHRALALGRVAVSRGHAIHIITNSRFAPSIPWKTELGEYGSVTTIPSTASREIATETVIDWIQHGNYDRLVVDTFPRGLVGELAPLLPQVSVPKILVHRDLNPDYVKKFNLFEAAKQFDLILLPGEDAPFANEEHARRTEPWLIRDATELLESEIARLQFGMEITDRRPLLVVSSSGLESEGQDTAILKQELANQLGDWYVRLASPIEGVGDITHWPLLSLLNGITALVGAGGYNTVHEARATATPLFASPLPRRYDQQALRLHANEHVSGLREIVANISGIKIASTTAEYLNGAHDAVSHIEHA